MINEISCKNYFSIIGQWDTFMLAWCKACTLIAGEKKERITKISTLYPNPRKNLRLYILNGEISWASTV